MAFGMAEPGRSELRDLSSDTDERTYIVDVIDGRAREGLRLSRWRGMFIGLADYG